VGDGEKLLTYLNSALKVLLGLDIFRRLPKKKLNFVCLVLLVSAVSACSSFQRRYSSNFHSVPAEKVGERYVTALYKELGVKIFRSKKGAQFMKGKTDINRYEGGGIPLNLPCRYIPSFVC
jgi:hypothetical protein